LIDILAFAVNALSTKAEALYTKAPKNHVIPDFQR